MRVEACDTSTVLPLRNHLDSRKLRVMPNMHQIDPFIQHVVGLPNRNIVISTGEMDDPCLLSFEKAHVFRGLINMRVEKCIIACRKQLEKDSLCFLEYNVGVLVFSKRVLQVPLT